MAEVDWSATHSLVTSNTPTIEFPPKPRSWISRLGQQLGFFPRSDVPDVTITPWNGIARIDFYDGELNKGQATGFLIKPDLVLTVGHAMSDAWPFDGLRICFQDDGDPAHQRLAPCKAYAYHGVEDLAVILVPPQPAASLRISGMQASTLTLAGFPESSPKLRTDSGLVGGTGSILRHDIKTRAGDSGAPLFAMAGVEVKSIAMHLGRNIDEQGRLRGKAIKLISVADAIDEIERLARAEAQGD